MSEELKILLLEDSKEDVELIQRELSNAGLVFVTQVVDTRPEFGEALKSFRPDVILSDHALPVFNSAEALKLCQKEKQESQLNAPFILVTGTVSEEFAAQCIKEGASDYILKDRLKQLPTAISRALKKKRSETEKELVHRICQIFSGDNTLEEDLKMSLAETCNQYHIDAAEAWIPSINAGYLKLAASYSVSGTLNYPNENDLVQTGEGMIGTTWMRKENIFVNNVQHDNSKTTNAFARINGLSSALALPIVFRNEVTAVLAFYSKRPKAEAGEIVIMGNHLLSQLASNIRRKKTEVERNNFFTLSPDIICIFGTDGYVKKINPAVTSILGYQEQEILSQPYINFIHPADQKVTIHAILQSNNSTSPHYFENKWITRNGDIKWLAWTVTTAEKNALVYAIGKDITEKKEAEQKLRLLHDELSRTRLKRQQEITSAAIAAQEAERQEIGRELHDNINQLLITARLYIGIVKMFPDNEEISLAKIDQLINTVIDDIRTMADTLIPPPLQKLGDVIKDLAIELKAISKLHIDCQLHLPDESKIPNKLKLNLYRIIQEQLYNIFKYAQADNVQIKMEQEEHRLTLQISDDGVGFDTSKNSMGVGFLNMQTRVSEFNGEIKISSAPDKGCTIEVYIPLA